VIKDFEVKEHLNSSLLKYRLNKIISMKFLRYSTEEKMDTLEALDTCVSDLCGMSYANFVMENKELNIDDIYIGDINNYNFGLKLIHSYFYKKRQQYQQYCVLNNEVGCYAIEEFEMLKANYSYTPISNKKLQIPHSNKVKDYAFNYNKSEAYIYANEQVDSILDIIDYEAIMSGDIIDNYKFIFYMRNFLISLKRTMNKIKRVYNGNRLQKKFASIAEEYVIKLNNESEFLENLVKAIKNKGDRYIDYSLGAFNENIWNNLDESSKYMVVENFNLFLSGLLGLNNKIINYDEWKLIELDDDSISVGNINETKSKDIFNAIVYSYAYSLVFKKFVSLEDDEVINYINNIEKHRGQYDENDFSKINDGVGIKEISKTAVALQKLIYRYVNLNLELQQYGIDFYGKEEDFVYDLCKETKKNVRGKK